MTTAHVTRALTRTEVRDVDRRALDDYGLPGLVLMENAGRGAAARLFARSGPASVAICAGKGNNGGDGLVMARHLELWGCGVHILLFAEPAELQGDAAVQWRIIERAGIPVQVCGRTPDRQAVAAALASAAWVVDALLGTGTQGAVREPYVTAIEEINRAGRPVLAVDLPSGLDCDTGRPLGPCIRAACTVTFVAPKVGFAMPDARSLTGDVEVVDIGVPRRLLADMGLLSSP